MVHPRASLPSSSTSSDPKLSAPLDEGETTRGRITWFCSEEDGGGPDVGLSLGLGGGKALYIGELANRTLEEAGIDLTIYPDGWWVALLTPDGFQVVGPVADAEAARELHEELAAFGSCAEGGATGNEGEAEAPGGPLRALDNQESEG